MYLELPPYHGIKEGVEHMAAFEQLFVLFINVESTEKV